MKHTLFFIFSLLPAFLTNHQEVVKTVTITADVHENLASLDDITTSLGGTVTFNEETMNYTYLINEQEITLNLEFGYSLVNGEKEALLVAVDEKTNLMTIQWQKPELIDEEIYVPIEYIERILGATYEDEEFIFSITEAHEDVAEEEEEIEEESEKVEVIANQSETNHPSSDESSSNQGTNQSKPQQTPTTPSKPESNPEDTNPSTPVEPESKPEDTKPSTPIEPESKPEDTKPSTPVEPESKPEDTEPSTPVEPESKPEDTKPSTPVEPESKPEDTKPSSEDVSNDLSLENLESESILSQDSNNLQSVE